MGNLTEKSSCVKQILIANNSGDSQYISKFWKSLLSERINFPDGERLKNFLSNDASYGYGNILEQNTHETFRRLVDTITPETPMEFLSKFTDPAFGGAICHRYKGAHSSIIFLQNIPTTYRIQKLPLKNGLRILEIGAGFGALAYQLNQILEIKKYTIVDIPHSLFLSYFYLSENTNRRCAFSSREKVENGFEFAKPDELDSIDSEFDLIINTISMGEMDIFMVERYKDLIKERLSEDGFFFSINTHGKAGIKKPSQYLIDGMRLYSMEPWVRRAHNSFFNKLHYEIIQTKNKGEVITEETKKKVDYQGRLFIVGVRPPFDDSVASYETGIKYYAQGKIEKARECLSEALNKGLKGFARTASILILTVTDRKAFLKFFDKKKKERIIKEAPIFEREIESFLSTPFSILKTRRMLQMWLKGELSEG